MLCHVILYYIIFYYVMSCYIIFYYIISFCIILHISYNIMLYHIISYYIHIISNYIKSHYIISQSSDFISFQRNSRTGWSDIRGILFTCLDVQRSSCGMFNKVHQLWVRTGYGSKFKTCLSLSFENACAQLIVSSTYLGGWCKKWQNDCCHFTGKILICQRILYGTPGKLEKYCELFKQWQITVWRVKPFWGLLFLFQQHYSNPQRDTHVAHLEMMETTSSNAKYPGDTFGIFWRTPIWGFPEMGRPQNGWCIM